MRVVQPAHLAIVAAAIFAGNACAAKLQGTGVSQTELPYRNTAIQACRDRETSGKISNPAGRNMVALAPPSACTDLVETAMCWADKANPPPKAEAWPAAVPEQAALVRAAFGRSLERF